MVTHSYFFLWLSGRLVRVLVSSLAVCWSRCPLDTSLVGQFHSLLICRCNLYT